MGILVLPIPDLPTSFTFFLNDSSSHLFYLKMHP